MATIEVDFEVFKALTQRRADEATTYNDVIRRLLRLPVVGAPPAGTFTEPPRGWRCKGVLFPNGTEFRMTYKGVRYFARVEREQLVMDGRRVNSPSEAALRISAKLRNGWRHWECRLPNESKWVRIEALREK